MLIEETDITWLDKHQTLSFDDLIELSHLSHSELLALVENGALVASIINDSHFNSLDIDVHPDDVDKNDLLKVKAQFENAGQDTSAWFFSSQCLVSIRTLSRLKADFELEDNALSLIMLYLERIRTLEAQLQQLCNDK